MGRLPLTELMGPAIGLARDGFVVDEYRSRSIASDRARLARFGLERELPARWPATGSARPCGNPTWRGP
jgi:gamma-glutamyltranspeptidase